MKLKLAVILLYVPFAGCAVLDTGPFMTGKVLDNLGMVSESLVAQADWKNLTANAGGSVNNPEFIVEGYTGPCYVFKTRLQMIGGKAEFSVAGAGTGTGYDAERLDALHKQWEDAGRPMTFGMWLKEVRNSGKDSDGDGITDDGEGVIIEQPNGGGIE